MADWGAVGASAVPLTGGYGGETFAVTAAGEDAVLRLHLRSPQRARIDVALTELVRGLLPVPRVLDAKPDGTADDPPYVLSERLPGVSLETFLPTADTAQRRRVGEQLGDLLATLSGIPFLRAGTFRDGDLTVEPFGPDDLPAGSAGTRSRSRRSRSPACTTCWTRPTRSPPRRTLLGASRLRPDHRGAEPGPGRGGHRPALLTEGYATTTVIHPSPSSRPTTARGRVGPTYRPGEEPEHPDQQGRAEDQQQQAGGGQYVGADAARARERLRQQTDRKDGHGGQDDETSLRAAHGVTSR